MFSNIKGHLVQLHQLFHTHELVNPKSNLVTSHIIGNIEALKKFKGSLHFMGPLVQANQPILKHRICNQLS